MLCKGKYIELIASIIPLTFLEYTSMKFFIVDQYVKLISAHHQQKVLIEYNIDCNHDVCEL